MTEKKKVYHKFQTESNNYHPMRDLPVVNPLPSGVYEFIYDWDSQRGWFKQIETNHDKLVDLPSKEFDDVVGEIGLFLNKETKNNYEKYGFLYKRSMLLYGQPGTGKTCIVNKVAEIVKRNGGIVLFNPNPNLISTAYEYLNDIQPDVLTLVVFEELDQLLENNEEIMLHILDGEIQKKNVVYLATTNFIDEIPQRICRPGRFSKLIPVSFPNKEARKVYLETKLDETDRRRFNIKEWVAKTENLSIDELKETVLSVCCLNQTLDAVVERILATKGIQENLIESKSRGRRGRDRGEIDSIRGVKGFYS